METTNNSIASQRPFATRFGLRLVAIIAGCIAAVLVAFLIMLPTMLLGIRLGPGLGSTAWCIGFFVGYQVYRYFCKLFKLKLRNRGEEEQFEKENNEVTNSASSLYEEGSNQIIDTDVILEDVALTEDDNAVEVATETTEEVALNESEEKSAAKSVTEEVEVVQSVEQNQRVEEVSTNTNSFDDKEVNSTIAITESDETKPNKAPKRRNPKLFKRICIIITSIILVVGLFIVYLSIHTKVEHEQLVQVTKQQIEIIEDRTIQKQDLTEAISLLKHCDENRFYCYYDHSQAIEELLDLYFQEQIDDCKNNVSRSYFIAMELFKLGGTDLGGYCDEYYKGETSKYSDSYSGVFVHNYAIIGVKILQYAAEQGDPDSQFALGCYYNGADFSTLENEWNDYTMLGKSVDHKKAAYWYLQAAEQGHRLATGALGHAYMYGKGVTRNEEKGVYWIQRAANLGSAFYQRWLGDLYRRGGGVRIGSHEEYETDPLGRYIEDRFLGGYRKKVVDDYDYNNAIIPKDIEQAKYWWRLAAENGDETAKERLQQIFD